MTKMRSNAIYLLDDGVKIHFVKMSEQLFYKNDNKVALPLAISPRLEVNHLKVNHWNPDPSLSEFFLFGVADNAIRFFIFS